MLEHQWFACLPCFCLNGCLLTTCIFGVQIWQLKVCQSHGAGGPSLSMSMVPLKRPLLKGDCMYIHHDSLHCSGSSFVPMDMPKWCSAIHLASCLMHSNPDLYLMMGLVSFLLIAFISHCCCSNGGVPSLQTLNLRWIMHSRSAVLDFSCVTGERETEIQPTILI